MPIPLDLFVINILKLDPLLDYEIQKFIINYDTHIKKFMNLIYNIVIY